jgi:4'-phosphopantetheinyl transferase EntD
LNSNFIKITSFPKVWLPNGGVLKGFDFEVSAYNPGLFDAWNVEFPLSLQTAVPKRQAEYLAGRIAGQHALKELGISNFDIESGKHRSPTWPNGILGSITHTDNMAFCAVSKKITAIC